MSVLVYVSVCAFVKDCMCILHIIKHTFVENAIEIICNFNPIV